MLFTIAFRNILRNSRRSLTTLSTIAVGSIAILLFAAFMMASILGVRTNAIQESGHLSVFRQGYFDYGAGNPSAYGIDDYEAVIARITSDPILKPMLRVVTPTVSLFGIAGNPQQETSKTFMGVGVVPADRKKLRTYDEYGLSDNRAPLSNDGLSDATPETGYVGIGLARILGLCAALKQPNCPVGASAKAKKVAVNVEGVPAEDFSDLADDTAENQAADPRPRLDLLGATANGAPNVVTFRVAKAVSKGAKAVDDMFIGMNLKLAQQLLYGRQTPKVTAIVIQLNRSGDMAAARARLDALFKKAGLDLEVRDYADMTPMYGQIMSFFGMMFVFIAVVMGIIVLFTVVNTMGMSVMERVNEIGTTRALGVRRSGIRQQFLTEGWLLGLFGATLGVALSYALAWIVNHSGIMWSPPGYAESYPLHLPINAIPGMVAIVWVLLIVVATVAALVPANRAARLPVVDALRHI